ncbi:MAG: hypothetical protein ACLPV4_19345 [Solirubrobacteraceae bacterium]
MIGVACHHCRVRAAMPGWNSCRICWADRWQAGPDELPTRKDGIAVTFAEPDHEAAA